MPLLPGNFLSRRPLAALAGVLAGTALAQPVLGQVRNPLQELEQALVNLYEEKAQAVVRVKVATHSVDAAGSENVTLTVFSGFFIDPDGIVLSNALPEDNVTRLWVEKDGRSFLAEAIASDSRSNIGLLRAVNLPESFAHIDLEPAAPDPRIGSMAFAITSPLDFAPSPSWGFVSGRESEFAEIDFPFTYTRIGVPIGPAEGGSPFFDTSGRLIGVAVAALPDIESAYIVPTQALKRIVEDLITEQSVSYGTLRMTFEELRSPERQEPVVAIKSIEAGSPAEQGGLRVGDEIVSLRDEPIRSVDQVRDLLFFSDSGVFIPLVIQRDGQTLDFALMLEPIAPRGAD